jgi:hypothetical protein
MSTTAMLGDAKQKARAREATDIRQDKHEERLNGHGRQRSSCPDSEIHRIGFRMAAGHKLLIQVAGLSRKFGDKILGPDTGGRIRFYRNRLAK